MKVLSSRCDCNPFQDQHVYEKFEGKGFVRLLWKCSNCKQKWIVKGTRTSKQASPAKWIVFFGWVEANE